MKVIKLFLYWLHYIYDVDLYYKPYKPNILGEHRYNRKTDGKNCFR